MKTRTIVIALALVALLALPALAAENRSGGFRIGAFLAGIDYHSMTFDYDDGGEMTYTSPGIGIGLLSPDGHNGLVAGYEIADHHEVGGFATLFTRSLTIDNEEKMDGSYSGVRMGPYYDFNFHVNEIMNPFVGGHMGILYTSDKMEDYKATMSGWLIGPQGGLKVNVYKHISLDATAWMDYGSGSGTVDTGDADADFDMSFWNFGVFAGMSVYIF